MHIYIYIYIYMYMESIGTCVTPLATRLETRLSFSGKMFHTPFPTCSGAMCSRRPGTYWLCFAFGVTMRPWLAASSSPEKMFRGGPQNIEHAESGLYGTGQDTKDPLEILHGAITRKVEALSQPYTEEMKDERPRRSLWHASELREAWPAEH